MQEINTLRMSLAGSMYGGKFMQRKERQDELIATIGGRTIKLRCSKISPNLANVICDSPFSSNDAVITPMVLLRANTENRDTYFGVENELIVICATVGVDDVVAGLDRCLGRSSWLVEYRSQLHSEDLKQDVAMDLKKNMIPPETRLLVGTQLFRGIAYYPDSNREHLPHAALFFSASESFVRQHYTRHEPKEVLCYAVQSQLHLLNLSHPAADDWLKMILQKSEAVVDARDVDTLIHFSRREQEIHLAQLCQPALKQAQLDGWIRIKAANAPPLERFEYMLLPHCWESQKVSVRHVQ